MMTVSSPGSGLLFLWVLTATSAVRTGFSGRAPSTSMTYRSS